MRSALLMIVLLITLASANGEEDLSKVSFVAKIEMIKGHMHASSLNKMIGDNDLAIAHAMHPIAEVYIEISEDIKAVNASLASMLQSRLDNLPSLVKTSSLDEYESEIMNIEELLDDVVIEVVGEEASKPEFLMRVIIELLEDAEEEYGEAVTTAGKIDNIVEYQDAQAFIARAKDIFNGIKDSIKEGREELELYFNQLDDAIREIKSVDDVENSISSMISKFEDMLAIEDPRFAYTARIEGLLDEIIKAYENGDYGEAERLVSEVMNNYGFIADDVNNYDESLGKRIEGLYGELVDKIEKSVSIDSIKDTIDTIRMEINVVEKQVIPEFPVGLIIALASIMSIAIVMSRRIVN